MLSLNFRSICFLLIWSFIVFSCNKDSEEPDKKYLLKVIVPDNVIGEAREGFSHKRWVFISDNNGKTLGAKEYTNNDILKFETPAGFNGEKILVSFLRILLSASEKHTHYDIETYEINVGEEVKLYNNPHCDIIGSASITVNNVPDIPQGHLNEFNILSVNEAEALSWKSFKPDGKLEMGVYLFESPIKSIVSFKLNDFEPYKYKILELKEDDSYNLDYNSLEFMTGKFEYDLPSDGFVQFYGITDLKDTPKEYYFGISPRNKGAFYYPEEMFSEFRIHTWRWSAGLSYSYDHFGGLDVSFEPRAVAHQILSTDINNFSITSEGVYDIYYLFFNDYGSVGDHRYNSTWRIYGVNSSSITGKLPEIPAVILKDNPMLSREKFIMNYLVFKDFVGMGGSEYISKYLKGEYINKGYYQVDYKTSLNNSSGNFIDEERNRYLLKFANPGN